MPNKRDGCDMKIVLLNTERRLAISLPVSSIHGATQFVDMLFPFHRPVRLVVSDFSDGPFA